MTSSQAVLQAWDAALQEVKRLLPVAMSDASLACMLRKVGHVRFSYLHSGSSDVLKSAASDPSHPRASLLARMAVQSVAKEVLEEDRLDAQNRLQHAQQAEQRAQEAKDVEKGKECAERTKARKLALDSVEQSLEKTDTNLESLRGLLTQSNTTDEEAHESFAILMTAAFACIVDAHQSADAAVRSLEAGGCAQPMAVRAVGAFKAATKALDVCSWVRSPDRVGRPSGHYRLLPPHPAHESHFLQWKSLHQLVLAQGGRLPSRPRGRKKMADYAAFSLSNFRPWHGLIAGRLPCLDTEFWDAHVRQLESVLSPISKPDRLLTTFATHMFALSLPSFSVVALLLFELRFC